MRRWLLLVQQRVTMDRRRLKTLATSSDPAIAEVAQYAMSLRETIDMVVELDNHVTECPSCAEGICDYAVMLLGRRNELLRRYGA